MDNILCTQEDNVIIIKFNRPDSLNAITFDTITELYNLLGDLEERADVGAVILTGNQRAFSAGADLKAALAARPAAPGLQGAPSVPAAVLERGTQLLHKIETMAKPVIAAIAGVCYGGGCEFALACDVRIVADNAKIALPEVKIGIIPGAGGTQRLPRIIGFSRAKYMMLTGNPIDAQTACEWGLAVQVTTPAQLLPAALNLAKQIAAGAPLGLWAIKQTALAAATGDLGTGLAMERQLTLMLQATDDLHEGLKAFSEKRPPVFRGR